MSTAITFDTHAAFVKRLKSVGFTEEQAEAFADEGAKLIEGRLATKQDITDLKRDIRELELRLKHDLIKWMFGMMVGQGALIVTLIKVLKF